MFEILSNGQVMRVENINTGSQIATVKVPVGMESRTIIISNKDMLQVSETATMTFAWERFDIGRGVYVPDSINTNIFAIEASGVVESIPVTDPVLIFNSAEPGEHIIKTINPGIDNGELKVIVNA